MRVSECRPWVDLAVEPARQRLLLLFAGRRVLDGGAGQAGAGARVHRGRVIGLGLRAQLAADLARVLGLGLLLGVVEAVGMHFTNPSLKALLSYVVFIGVLLLRPEGLFARKTRKA